MIDRKYFGLARVAAIMFAVVVVLFVLVDFLAFGGGEVKMRVDVAGAKRELRGEGDSLVLRIPVVLESGLPVGLTNRSFVVTVGGERVSIEGEGDSVGVPVVLRVGDSVMVRVEAEAGFLYRGWRGSWKDYVKGGDVEGEMLREALKVIGERESVVGEYRIDGGKAIVSVEFGNRLGYDVGLEWKKKPYLQLQGDDSVMAEKIPESVVVGKEPKLVELEFKLPSRKKGEKWPQMVLVTGEIKLLVGELDSVKGVKFDVRLIDDVKAKEKKSSKKSTAPKPKGK